MYTFASIRFLRMKYYYFVPRLKMRKWAALCFILCCIIMAYYVMYPPMYHFKEDIPHPSCTELGNTYVNTNRQMSNSGDIMTAVYLTSGKGYTNFTASVIREYHAIADEDINIFTVNAFKYTKSTLQAWYGKNVKVFELESQAVATKTLFEEFLQSKHEILFLIDSEMVFLRNWINFITEHMIRRRIPFLSLYHSATMHSFTKDCETSQGDLCKGDISAKFGVAMTKDIANIILKKYTDFRNFNYDWTTILREAKVQSLYPAKSIVMQIGRSKQEENYCGENEVPYGFKLCELPCWIRDGIELYFDRCTNPQETFSMELSLQRANNERRQWCRPAISYSLYGNKTRYSKQALKNSKRVFSIYPGWKIWIYIDGSVKKDLVDQLCENNVRFVNMSRTDIQNKMSWRFLVASEPVKMYAVRDLDSLLIPRGKAAVDEWIKSGRKFHVMRDHPNHSRFPMSGGMWGGTKDAIPNMAKLVRTYRGENSYLVDMNFLNEVVWKIANNSVWAHDSFSLHKFGEDHDFPTRRDPSNFVGA